MRKLRKHIQLSLDSARKPDGRHGGWRPNAGRPKRPGAVSHQARPEFRVMSPEHVTLRICDGVESVAREFLMKHIRACIRLSHKPGFRVVEFNVLANHLHLITEAANKECLARGVQGLSVRVARTLNAVMERKGALFAQRYHARILKNPTQVRYALRYVLLNRKHHDVEKRFSKTWFDPCSSAAWFEGWATPLYANAGWQKALLEMERPTARPTTWLLTTGWKQLGLLQLDDRPAS